jgi:hypothetical protein
MIDAVIFPPNKKMTQEQIEKAVAYYRALLEKHASELSAEAVQTVLSRLPELADAQFGIFRHRVEAVSNWIVRRVKVNRDRVPQKALDATGRRQYTNRQAVDEMPYGETDEVEVVFFTLNFECKSYYISDDDLRKEFEIRGLKPVDPISLAAMNEEDPVFADAKPHGTHWKDDQGYWCHMQFCYTSGERSVSVYRGGGDWSDYWWYAGVRHILT